ncbi:MAG: CubicO group peptidase (beta-lactamase class C family) [Crocinitomicaceae bacterium]|jgi:CubicO group peptidase (beta-lactamase class C family)
MKTPAHNDFSDDVTSYLARCCNYFSLPELSVLILDGDSTKSYPNNGTSSSIFKVGSLTKIVTSLSVLLLVAEGKLNLDDKISSHLDWFDGGVDHALKSQITIKEVLLHISGLPRGDFLKQNPTQDELQEMLSKQSVKANKGNHPNYKYSNLGYVILGCVIEALTKTSYATFVQQQIFNPLEMKDSGFGAHSELTTPHGLHYFSSTGSKLYNLAEIPTYDAPHAAFDMHASSRDFSNLMRCILDGGNFKGNQVFSQKSISRFFNDTIHLAENMDAGYGFLRMKAYDGKMIFLDGEHWGHSATLMLLPKKKYGIVAMTNRASGSAELSHLCRSITNYSRSSNVSHLHYNKNMSELIVGEYVSNSDHLNITSNANGLFISYNKERPSYLGYRGRGTYVHSEGGLAKYLLRMDPTNVNALIIGPYYFQKMGSGYSTKAELKHKAITGIYLNNEVGRLALFERNTQLILAYSPFREVSLEKKGGVYIQRDGVFIGDEVKFDQHKKTMIVGGRIFDKTEEFY